MPMIDLTIPPGALDPAARSWLVDELLSALLRWERAPDNERSRSLAWAFVNEADAVTVAGDRRAPTLPRYRVGVRTPAGALDDERRSGLVGDVTELVLRAEGSLNTPENADRVWVILDEVTEGGWGAGGRIWRLADMAGYVLDDPDTGAAFAASRLVQS